MFGPIDRRRFVSGAVQAGAVAGLADFAFLDRLPGLEAAAVPVRYRKVALSPDVEPLVRLIEDAPSDAVLERVADRIRAGTSYQELLAALFLAGVRGIQPRPVGFKFHAVLVINSAHLASLSAADRDRWLPLFWALDYFKRMQVQNREQGDWRMAPVAEAKLPAAAQAHERFKAAMDNWDVEAADVAVASLARTAGANEAFELFWYYGARDFRDIGHKAIYAANAYRTLQAIGWRHAEPVLRSLAYAQLEHEGTNPARRDDERDRVGRRNLERARDLKGLGLGGAPSTAAATELLTCLRSATAEEASVKVAELLRKKVHPASIWDGLFLTAGELLMRQPGNRIVGLHCVTSINALHFAWQTSANDQTRRFLLLQGAGFLALFRKFMATRGVRLLDVKLDALEKVEVRGRPEDALREVFADLSRDRLGACRKALALLEKAPGAIEPLIASARRLIFSKGHDSHDYKFSSAALEDYYHVSPAWRARFAASSLYNLKGTGDTDNGLIRRARAALARA